MKLKTLLLLLGSATVMGMASAGEPHDKAVSAYKCDFSVYPFIPWERAVATDGSTQISGHTEVQSLFSQLGFKPVDVIYGNRWLTNGQVDSAKIAAVAQEAKANSDLLISFDVEKAASGMTVQATAAEVLKIYHQAVGGAQAGPVGLYGLLPINSFGGNKPQSNLSAANRKNAFLAPMLSVLSPVLYNYAAGEQWKYAAAFDMGQARQYADGKPVLPYVTSEPPNKDLSVPAE